MCVCVSVPDDTYRRRDQIKFSIFCVNLSTAKNQSGVRLWSARGCLTVPDFSLFRNGSSSAGHDSHPSWQDLVRARWLVCIARKGTSGGSFFSWFVLCHRVSSGEILSGTEFRRKIAPVLCVILCCLRSWERRRKCQGFKKFELNAWEHCKINEVASSWSTTCSVKLTFICFNCQFEQNNDKS